MKRRAAKKIDRALEESAEAVTAAGKKGYDIDAQAIAAIMARHYGDEAEAVLDRTKLFLDDARAARKAARRAARKAKKNRRKEEE